MNGSGTRRSYDMDPAPLSPFRNVKPSPRAMVNGYREEVMDGFETRRPKYNPMNADRPQSSPLVDLKDPIQVHLLTETALADSREWEILSQEEVDGLKKQVLSLTQRIEQTRANLAIQSKYRDAAISMTKLYSPGKRRSILGNRDSGGDGVREAEAERAACERRCEELASELFALEKRIMEPQRQLLQHTAGILQLTHKATAKRQVTPANIHAINGIPGSPESLYTYSNGRESMELTSSPDGLDERGLYLPIGLEQQMSQQSTTNVIKIPQKSPIRKEAKELRDETTRLQTECEQLQASNESLGQELNTLQAESSERQQVVANAEQQMGYINGRLREVVVQLDPEKYNGFQTPPPASDSKAGAGLVDQLQYLDETLQTIEGERERLVSANAGPAKSEALFQQIEEQMAAVNGQIQQMLSAKSDGDDDSSLAPVPATSNTGSEGGPEAGIDEQLNWLQGALPVLESEMARAGDASGARQTEQDSAERVNTVLSGLWDIMQSGLMELQRKRAERKAVRAQRGMATDDGGDEDLSGDESPMGVDEPYSLEAFSAEVQWLYEQTTKLREHKSVLKRQVKQQRELNNKSDAQKDEELRNKEIQLEEARQATEAAQDELARALTDLNVLQQQLLEHNEASVATEGVQEQLAERDNRVAALEARGTELQQALAAAQADVAEIATQLQEAAGAEQAARKAEATAKETAEQAQQQAQQAQEAQEAARLASQQAAQQAQEAQQALQAAQQAQQAQQTQLAELGQQSQQSQKAVQQAEETTRQLQQQLQEAQEAAERAGREVQGKEEELERLNDMVVELKTEATIAKAELDGAYGSRRQRAADVAALAKSSADEALQEQLAGLKEELAGTLKEYEDLTRDSVAAEREKVDLEGQLDEALAARAALEAEARALREKLDVEVTALKEQLDVERLKVVGGGGGTRAGASLLSDQFRATMKEERKKFQEELRGELALRRKLEDELRTLRRAAKPIKSPLSPQVDKPTE